MFVSVMGGFVSWLAPHTLNICLFLQQTVETIGEVVHTAASQRSFLFNSHSRPFCRFYFGQKLLGQLVSFCPGLVMNWWTGSNPLYDSSAGLINRMQKQKMNESFIVSSLTTQLLHNSNGEQFVSWHLLWPLQEVVRSRTKAGGRITSCLRYLKEDISAAAGAQISHGETVAASGRLWPSWSTDWQRLIPAWQICWASAKQVNNHKRVSEALLPVQENRMSINYY